MVPYTYGGHLRHTYEMRYELIALDIDGTIRTLERPISARTRSAVEEVRRRGAVITLATGRMFQSAVDATTELDLTEPIVSYQGAHIGHPVTGEVLRHRPLTADMALAVLDLLATWDREVLAYRDDHVYANTLTPWVEAYAERNKGRVHVVSDLNAIAGKEPTRLVAVGDEDEIYRLEVRLKAAFDSRLHITRSLPYFCEILHREAGKHRALAWLCRRLGVPQERTVAFGNAHEDVEMLRWAGLGVAVGGAQPEVLQAADRVAPPVEEDGVARTLEDLLERGLVG